MTSNDLIAQFAIPSELLSAVPTSSAADMRVRQAEAERRLAPLRTAVSRMTNDLLMRVVGREICARRARKLRRRGEFVTQLSRRTCNGKPRYWWVPRVTFHFEGLS